MSNFLQPSPKAAGILIFVLLILAACCVAGELTVQAAPLQAALLGAAPVGRLPSPSTVATPLAPTLNDVSPRRSPRPRPRTSAAPGHPSRATIIEVQRLFHELGYPLGTKPLGGLGVRTRGALYYFQRKYGLPVTGYPDARTIAEMQSVAASLRGSSAVAQAPPHDLVERVLGDDLPILTIAIALAAVLCLLALSARDRPAQEDSATAEDTIIAASGDS
jgi:hypothetical protein